MRTFASLCLVAVAVSGCGGAPRDSAKEFKGEERAVAAAIESLESAARGPAPMLSTSSVRAWSGNVTSAVRNARTP